MRDSAHKEYVALRDIDLFDSQECKKLSTQVAKGRHLRVKKQDESQWLVELCEDNYLAWLPIKNTANLEEAIYSYQSITLGRLEIEKRIESVINFALASQKEKNFYLWGGTVAPNYDCSGLIQAAFASQEIWLPRDSCQQANFCQKISKTELIAGDLIFFGDHKVNHVALYLGNNQYIHSSGKDFGRNGIGIDVIEESGDPIGERYFKLIKYFGRINSSYIPRQNE